MADYTINLTQNGSPIFTRETDRYQDIGGFDGLYRQALLFWFDHAAANDGALTDGYFLTAEACGKVIQRSDGVFKVTEREDGITAGLVAQKRVATAELRRCFPCVADTIEGKPDPAPSPMHTTARAVFTRSNGRQFIRIYEGAQVATQQALVAAIEAIVKVPVPASEIIGNVNVGGIFAFHIFYGMETITTEDGRKLVKLLKEAGEIA